MGRILAFLYGLICYVIFFGAFCYLIGFMGNILVPKTIDTGASGPLAAAVLINLGLVALFGIQHSVMARPGFKKVWTKVIPEPIERSTYVLLSSLVLILLYWQWQPMPAIVWQLESETARLVMMGIFFLGCIIVLLSTMIINHFDLFGLRQVYLHLRAKPQTSLPFQIKGFYRIVRHPLMTGFLIALWAAPTMTQGHLLFTVTMTLYIFIGIHFEERDLARAFGEQYERYRRETPMVLPVPKRHTKGAAPAEQ